MNPLRNGTIKGTTFGTFSMYLHPFKYNLNHIIGTKRPPLKLLLPLKLIRGTPHASSQWKSCVLKFKICLWYQSSDKGKYRLVPLFLGV